MSNKISKQGHVYKMRQLTNSIKHFPNIMFPYSGTYPKIQFAKDILLLV